MRYKKFLFIIVIIILISILFSCSKVVNKDFSSLNYLNTHIVWRCLDVKDNDEIKWNEVLSIIDNVENKYSVYKEDSVIYKFNHANPNDLIECEDNGIFEMILDIYNNTNGYFNPAMYLLSDLWGFTDRFSVLKYKQIILPYDREDYKEELPDEKYIEAFLRLSDFSKVELIKENGKMYIKKPNLIEVIDGNEYSMQLDLGGVLKGYLASIASNKILEDKREYGYISFGTSSIGILKREDKKMWNVKIKDPLDYTKTYASIPLENSVLSTSGDYEQYYEIEEKRYCHIINPKTGWPIDTNIISSSVVYFGFNKEDGAKSDAYATAIMAMSIDEAKEFVRSNNLNAMFVYKENNEYKVFNTIKNVEIDKKYKYES